MSLIHNIFSIFEWQTKPSKGNPIILPQKKHQIPLSKIDKGVIDILYRLRSRRFDARLVGGCVRDLLLDRKPKDFDIVTDARPGQVKSLFYGCRLIGRRFRLAHVPTGRGMLVEVATYRGLSDPPEETNEPVEPKDRFLANNVFGTIDQDAFRRDFTVNALYYDFKDHSILDYTGGLSDLKKKRLRSINEPDKSFKEDPVRIIRAARFAAILGFELSRADMKAALSNAGLIAAANPSRMLEELRKILKCGHSAGTFRQLQKYECLKYWIPEFAAEKAHALLLQRLEIMDKRIREGARFSEELLIACLCFDLFQTVIGPFGEKGFHQTFEQININFRKLAIALRVPRWVWHGAVEIAARQAVYRRTPGGRKWGKFLRIFLRSPMHRDSITFLDMDRELTGNLQKEYDYWNTLNLAQIEADEQKHDKQKQKTIQNRRNPHTRPFHHRKPERQHTQPISSQQSGQPNQETEKKQESSNQPERTFQPDIQR